MTQRSLAGGRNAPVSISYHTIRSVTSPEDQSVGRKRYCGVATAEAFFGLDTDENVRGYLSRDVDGNRRKATLVNKAIQDTLVNRPDVFQLLNTGLVIVARKAEVDDQKRSAQLWQPSIINGAQTCGVLRDYFQDNLPLDGYPSVNFELLVTDDEELIADISIARNYQNRVEDLSIYGRQGRFDALEESMRKAIPGVRLRKSETDYGDDFLDTEKLIQVLTVMAPGRENDTIPLPSAVQRKERTPETVYRVYAYRHRSRCLKDFATVMDNPKDWPEAHRFFLGVAADAWAMYQRLKGEQAFSSLKCVKGDSASGRKLVQPDGVPDGIVFPMLSALSRFIERSKSGFKLNVPRRFPWATLFAQAEIQEKTTASHNPQTMGKDADCYISLHGAIDMYFAVASSDK